MCNDTNAVAAWRARPEIRAQLDQIRSRSLDLQSDGTYLAYEMEPGDYVLSVAVVEDVRDSGRVGRNFAQAVRMVTVPELPGTDTVDLGELVLEPTPKPAVSP
jgi:hypothetical protein